MVISSAPYARRNGSRLPPPPPGPPPSARGGQRRPSSQSLADHVAVLQAELDAAVREARKGSESSGLPPPPPPPIKSSSTRRRRSRSRSIDRPPAVVLANSHSSLGTTSFDDHLDGSDASGSSYEYDSYDEEREYSGKGKGVRGATNSVPTKQPNASSKSTTVILHVLVALLAALLGAVGGYVASHARHGDLVLDTYVALDRLQKMEQHHRAREDQASPPPSSASRATSSMKSAPPSLQSLYDDAGKREAQHVMQTVTYEEEMQKYVRRIEYDNAVRKYGEGPHRIMFTLDVPHSYYPDVNSSSSSDSSNLHPERPGVRARFYVDTVPLSLMPHSVKTFLDMIDKGLYNGVRLNAITEDGNPAIDFDLQESHEDAHPAILTRHANRFFQKDDNEDAAVKKAIATMEYDERHADVARGRGTVAFLERGPGMVFDVQNGVNAEDEDSEGHFGCFARVVEGLDALEHLVEASRGGSSRGAAAVKAGPMREPVTIRVARLMRPHEYER